MMILTIVIGLQLLLTLIMITVLHKKGKNEYFEELEDISKDEFPMKSILPIGMYMCDHWNIVDKLPIVIQGMLQRRQNEKRIIVVELYGAEYSSFYHWVFSAEKKAVMLMIICGSGFIGFLSCTQGDIETGVMVDVLGLLFAASMEILYDSKLDTAVKERRVEIKREFPEFVNKMVLLVSAGMTIPKVWEKVVLENTKDTSLQKELKKTYIDIQNGMGEIQAIDAFGRRCKVKEIMKFSTIIAGSMKKGGMELTLSLTQMSQECWDMRCNQAKEDGEKLGTKLLLPTMLLFGALLIVVMAPAMMLMGGV